MTYSRSWSRTESAVDWYAASWKRLEGSSHIAYLVNVAGLAGEGGGYMADDVVGDALDVVLEDVLGVEGRLPHAGVADGKLVVGDAWLRGKVGACVRGVGSWLLTSERALVLLGPVAAGRGDRDADAVDVKVVRRAGHGGAARHAGLVQRRRARARRRGCCQRGDDERGEATDTLPSPPRGTTARMTRGQQHSLLETRWRFSCVRGAMAM